MNFNLGNVMKYIWRCGDKGKPIEDLKKAIWYIEREIDRLGREAVKNVQSGVEVDPPPPTTRIPIIRIK